MFDLRQFQKDRGQNVYKRPIGRYNRTGLDIGKLRTYAQYVAKETKRPKTVIMETTQEKQRVTEVKGFLWRKKEIVETVTKKIPFMDGFCFVVNMKAGRNIASTNTVSITKSIIIVSARTANYL